MTRIISVLNHKGGVGKTTTSINLASALAEKGKKTLLVDIDGQANLTIALGIKNPSESLYEALRGDITTLPIIERKNLDIVPASLDLQASETELMNEPGRELILKGLLEDHLTTYDYIIIDCPPSLGLLTINSLTASTDIIIPVEAEYLAIKGMTKLLSVIDKVKQRLNPKIEILGLLITKYDSRKTLGKLTLETLENNYSDMLLKTKIRDNTTIAQAQVVGETVLEFDSKSIGASDYRDLAKEIMTK